MFTTEGSECLPSEHHREEAFSSSEANTAPQAEETAKDEDNGYELREETV